MTVHGRRRIGMTAAAMLAFLASIWSSPGSEVDELETLLRELRVLRATAQRESDEFRQEQQRMKLLIDQRKRTLEVVAKEAATLGSDNRKASQKLEALQKSRDASKQSVAAQKAAFLGLIRDLVAQLRQMPALADANDLAGLNELLDKPPAFDQLTASFWSQLLKLAGKAIDVRMDSREIAVGERRLHANVLWLGGLCAVWLTDDGKHGGTGRPVGAQMQWQALAEGELAGIRDAIKVARRSAPARVVLLPVAAEGGGK